MNPMESEILSQVTQKTNSELILFFIIFAIILVVFLLPLYGLLLKDKKEKHKAEKEKRDDYMQREKQIIEVIKENSEVIASLKVTLENNSVNTNSSLNRLHDKMDAMSIELGVIKAKQEQVASDQIRILNDIQTVLMIVDSLPHKSNFHAGKEPDYGKSVC